MQRLKHTLRSKAPKTVNNILTVLNVLLRKAVEWDVIEQMPCSVKLLPVTRDRRVSMTSPTTNGWLTPPDARAGEII